MGPFYGLRWVATRGRVAFGRHGGEMRKARLSVAAVATAGLLAVAGCAGNDVELAPAQPRGLACVDDSKHCVESRMHALKGMMADKSRAWVREPATPAAYASGVRLFAFKGRKKELTCEELAVGKREADAGPGILRGSGGAGLSPGQISRGAMLSGEVSKELGLEMRRRCRA